MEAREFSCTLCNSRLKPFVQLLELARLPEKLHEYFDLRAQDFRNHRYGHVVDRTHLVPTQAINVGQQDGGNENQCRFLEARMIADHRRQLKTIDVRHVDVDENDRDVTLQQQLERLGGVACA